MNIVSVYPSFARKGGAEDMAISIACNIKDENNPIVMHSDNEIFSEYALTKVNFQKLSIKNISKCHHNGYIFLSHHRKTTTYLLLISYTLFLGKLRIIHIAHNTFSSLKHITLFPKYNIAVSETVKQNMNQYFGVPNNRIQVIYNGIQDRFCCTDRLIRMNNEKINIIFMGRIDPVKQQVEFVRQSKGKLNEYIRIYFAGVGKDAEILNKEIGKDPHYIYLGLINPYNELPKFDYVCLFSKKEGLPLSLIEGEMFGKPLITNDIPQNIEINSDKITGFVNHSWKEIINCINNLPFPGSKAYNQLSKNARNTYIKKFDFNKMIDSYSSYINSIKW